MYFVTFADRLQHTVQWRLIKCKGHSCAAAPSKWTGSGFCSCYLCYPGDTRCCVTGELLPWLQVYFLPAMLCQLSLYHYPTTVQCYRHFLLIHVGSNSKGGA